MDSLGLDPCPKIPRIPEMEELLLEIFQARYAELLLMAAMDDTKRRNITYVLDMKNIVATCGGQANYCKKERRFDFIQYSSKGYMKRIGL